MINETAMKSDLGDDFVEKVPSMLRRLAAEYGPDSKLPSVRELSRRFGVSTMELGAALEELERDELVYRRGRVGTRPPRRHPTTAAALAARPVDHERNEGMTQTTPQTVPQATDAMAPPWRGINHLALVTSDMDATVRFYHGTLGARLVATIGTPA